MNFFARFCICLNQGYLFTFTEAIFFQWIWIEDIFFSMNISGDHRYLFVIYKK